MIVNIDGTVVQLLESRRRVPASREEMRKHLQRLLSLGCTVEELASKINQPEHWLTSLLSGESS